MVRMQVRHHEQLLGSGQGPQAGHCPAGRLVKAHVLQFSAAQHACACNPTQQMHVSLQLAPCLASCLLLHKMQATPAVATLGSNAGRLSCLIIAHAGQHMQAAGIAVELAY